VLLNNGDVKHSTNLERYLTSKEVFKHGQVGSTLSASALLVYPEVEEPCKIQEVQGKWFIA
jgi:hypothetical protein